jgi:hypothetical protein
MVTALAPQVLRGAPSFITRWLRGNVMQSIIPLGSQGLAASRFDVARTNRVHNFTPTRVSKRVRAWRPSVYIMYEQNVAPS